MLLPVADTHSRVEERALQPRRAFRAGPDHISRETGISARTVTRILRRQGALVLAACDPVTGQRIRASRISPAAL
ncbi:hypothetical protein [Actinomadura rugatobispora]|uniref:Helix-turn-helix domain-containing protein n=1 Tax=Actinomadura rugatobispora TaxID=1994 RepID=A0ABW1AGR8_9ACTN